MTAPHSGASAESEICQRIAGALGAGRRVAAFLDYDGTLREIEHDPPAAAPTPEVSDLLDCLSHNDRLAVTIVSGRTARDLQAVLGHYPLGLPDRPKDLVRALAR